MQTSAVQKLYQNKRTLAIPSAAVLQVVELAEAYFRKNELDLINSKVGIPAFQEKVMASLFAANSFPPCHELPKKIVQFLQTRMHILVKKSDEAESKRLASRKSGSRSIAMRDAITKVQ